MMKRLTDQPVTHLRRGVENALFGQDESVQVRNVEAMMILSDTLKKLK
jgi:hypothetical protein